MDQRRAAWRLARRVGDLRRRRRAAAAGAAPGPPLALHQPLLLPPPLLWLLLALLLSLLLALLLRLRQQWRGWPLGEPACTCRRCCVKPLAERRWQSTHGRQALKKTAVPEPARELPLAKQARALRRPHAAGCPGRCAIAPAGWMASLWRGARVEPRSALPLYTGQYSPWPLPISP